MSGIGMILNTAKHALAAQQIGLNVTGHNISNVNTENFSRQSAVLENRDPVHYNNFILGTGVEVNSVIRSSSMLLENRLMDQKSELARYNGAESYMALLESIFNETSETNLSGQISDFWNAWHDLSNMPTGFPERLAVYDSGARLAEQFQWLNDSMLQVQTDIEREVQAGIDQINTLADQIAEINVDIVADSINNNPNDQLDKRNALVNQLAGLIDIQTYEQPTGALTVATNTGHLLVYGADTFKLEMRSGQVNWVDSQSGGVDITDKIKGGSLGGWLEMRDEVLPKYQQELDVLTEELIWNVNSLHSQGVGIDFFTDTLTGAYRTDSTQMFDTLAFGDRIDYTGDFKMWVKDAAGNPPVSITVDMDTSTSGIDYGAAGMSFTTPSDTYVITATSSGTVAGATDINFTWQTSSGTGTGVMVAGDDFITLDDGSQVNLTAGSIVEGNSLRVNVDAAGNEDSLKLNSVSGTANSALDTYRFTVKTGGVIGTDPVEIEWQNSATSGIFIIDPTAPMDIEVDGMTVDFASGTMFSGDVFTVATDDTGNPSSQLSDAWNWTVSSFADAFNRASDTVAGGGVGSGFVQASVTTDNRLSFTPAAGYSFAFSDAQPQDAGVAAALGFNTFFTGDSASNIAVNSALDDKDNIAAALLDSVGEYGVGDNSNAIAIAEIQYTTIELAQWNFDRSGVDTSGITSNTLEGFYQGMVGAMGIKSASINRNVEFNQVMVEKIKEQRDALSGVNLDEEMINLMKFQHAFAVASKLLTTADEMLQTLLSVK